MSRQGTWSPTGACGRVVLVALVVAVLTSCGVRPQDRADPIDPDEVPFDLLEPGQSTTTAPASGRTLTIYLVAGDRLVAVSRRPPAGSELEPVTQVLEDGPTEAEMATGITTALPEGEISSVVAERGIATVDLEASFADIPSTDQLLATAQLVYTLTGQPGVGSVDFTLAGEPIEIPRGDGALTSDALTREDLPAVAPEP